MKVLWLTNIPIPEASILLNEKPSPYGGWLITASKLLAKTPGIDLTIIFPKNGVKNFVKVKGNKITYYAFKPVKDKDNYLIENNAIFQKIINDVKPDIVHIYGTELAHTLSMVNICEKEKVVAVLSIQGLVSKFSYHLYANLPFNTIYGATIRNIIRGDSIIGLKNLYNNRGNNEIKSIRKVKNLIGRTTWDKASTLQINPKATYYFCNETLREEFYNNEWKINECEKYSIFLSQGQYPIKGLHYMIEAMPFILERFPNTKVYVSGKDVTKSSSIKDKLLMTKYGKYIKKLIRKYKLENNIIFLGPLNEKQICERYKRSNIFVCPSSIENSPNSLGEAMILGVPSIAANVGGVPDMLINNQDGFVYQADAPYMLAHYICEVFGNDELALNISKSSRERALKRHDPSNNNKRLIEIYKDILQKRD